MPTPFSSEDLGRIFDSRAITRGRSLGLAGQLAVELEGNTIVALVNDHGADRAVRITPSRLGRRVLFDNHCTCHTPGCSHVAAAALAALDHFPILRKPEQQTFLDALSVPPEPERQRIVFELAPGEHPHACIVATLRIGDRTGTIASTTPERILAEAEVDSAARNLAQTLRGGETRTGVRPDCVEEVMRALLQSGQARWHAGGKLLSQGGTRVFASAGAVVLPPRSGVIVGSSGPWYVDAATGEVGRIRIQPLDSPAAPPMADRGRPEPPRRRAEAPDTPQPIIMERPPTPVVRLTRFPCPDNAGRMQVTDALLLEFDYDGNAVPFDDERQFVRVTGPAGAVFIRRDTAAETAALNSLRQDGFVQMRMALGQTAKGRIVMLFRGRDAAEAWERFITERVPTLLALGWRSLSDAAFGPRIAPSGSWDLRVADAPNGRFSLDLGIEIDGARQSLLPILLHLRECGGMPAARIVDGQVITRLDDGRIVKLPADRIGPLLAVFDHLIESASRASSNSLVLDEGEAASVLDLEDLLATRWQDGTAIAARLARFRTPPKIPAVPVPAGFTATLRPYQQHGVNWLQYLRRNELAGLLADDMGLGKTVQTVAHIAIEEAAARLDRPVLVVVPTSLVPNWTAEFARFAPHLRLIVLHGLDRHERRRDFADAHVVVTTYSILTRDSEQMAELAWHLVVLDEAQAIKNPGSKATHAACRLNTRHRLCLSGTPIENNLGELWSQFAFLMPGLLGAQKTFARRFRTPIEKDNDAVRRQQLATRIRPFILRRTKAEVAPELPPKHTILRRITLAPEQRDLYEAIRATLHEEVRHEIAARGAAPSQIMVLDALLKLRQICCDPRLVKLPGATIPETSSKLQDVLEMISEMIAEGRRILLFSQFTSMLDLMKPALDQASIPFVELRGDTHDRAAPVRRFEAGEVPVFLISLKAGGRGLNLVSADTVIHYDPWWNPAAEDQASDRAHRIGQAKSVFVYKLIAADTIEERILDLQERKAALAGLAFSGESGSGSAIDSEDVEFLFGARPARLAA